MKDSDVTWLYGPLHTASDWAPPPRQVSSDNQPEPATHQEPRQHRSHSPHPTRSNSPWPIKPILKHRSISELLSISFPNTPNSEPLELPHDGYFSDHSGGPPNTVARISSHELNGRSPKRPRLMHTRSDTNILRRNPFRGDSPPLPLIPEGSAGPKSTSLAVPSSSSPCSQDSSGAESSNTKPEKRHISFNTFVEQCIAIEKPKNYDYSGDEEEDEDAMDEEGYREDDEYSNDDYDSDEDVLEMRSSRRNSMRSNPGAPFSGLEALNEREHVTIAPIAPTILKTSASPSPVESLYGPNGVYASAWGDEEDVEELLFSSGSRSGNRVQSPPDVEYEDRTVPLVFVPPQGSVYADRLGVNGARAFGGFPSHSSRSRSRSRSSSSSPGGSFEDPDIYQRREKEDGVEVEHDEGDGIGFAARGVSDEVVYEPYRGREGGGDEVSSQHSEVRSTDSKGGSSEEGTVVPASGMISSSVSEMSISPEMDTTSNATSAPIPVPSVAASPVNVVSRHSYHSPSPAPSATSTSTTTTTSNGSPSMDATRGRSTSPITSASPSGDSSRGRSFRRASSDHGDVKDDREAPRGRSRSRSIGGADGSVSPRNGMSRRASVESGMGLGMGYGYSCGPRERKERDVSSSLSPEDAGRGVRVGRVGRSSAVSIRRIGSEGSDGSSSLSPPARDSQRQQYTLKGSKPIDIPIPAPPSKVPAVPPSPLVTTNGRAVAVDVLSLPEVAATASVVPSFPPSSSSTPTSGTSGTNTPTSSATVSTASTPAAISTPAPSTVVAPSISVSASTPTLPIPIPLPRVEEPSIVGRAMSSAKGYLGSFWGTSTNSQAQTAAR